MLMLTPKLYLFEFDPSPREEKMFMDCGCEFFLSVGDFIAKHRDLILDIDRVENPDFYPCAYTISDDRTYWVCDRGIRNPIGTAWESLLHFILGFEQ